MNTSSELSTAGRSGPLSGRGATREAVQIESPHRQVTAVRALLWCPGRDLNPDARDTRCTHRATIARYGVASYRQCAFRASLALRTRPNPRPSRPRPRGHPGRIRIRILLTPRCYVHAPLLAIPAH